MPISAAVITLPPAAIVSQEHAASVRAIRLRLEALSIELRRALGDGPRK